MTMNKELKLAIELAKNKIGNSHSPYSKFKVAAVVKALGVNEMFTGVNVENASYGSGICAERAAIFNMVQSIGYRELDFVLIYSEPGVCACLACQQVISEFTPNNPIPIYSLDYKGNIIKNSSISTFNPKSLC